MLEGASPMPMFGKPVFVGNWRLRPRLRLLGLLFVLTGCAGLFAEQSFEKLLTGLVGASTPAAAMVLAAYFLGLTLGAWAYSRFRRGKSAPLRVYALLEGGVALWSLLLLLLWKPIIVLLAPVLRLGADHFWVLQGLRFLVSCLWILPPTLLMGATFPSVVEVLEGWRVPQARRAVSRFYALNLVGAILGALIGPYWAFPMLGLGGVLLFTFLLDMLACLSAWKLHELAPVGKSTEVFASPLLKDHAGRTPRLLLFLAALSGFVFFSLEVVWTHLIGAVLGNSVYAFACMLALVLLGLGLGGALATRVFPRKCPISWGSVGCLLVGGSGLLALQFPAWPTVPQSLVVWGQGLTEFSQGELLRWIQAARLLLPSTVVLGMVYPALFRLEAFPLEGRGRTVARMGAVNSAACVLGALMTGFWLVPRFGSEWTLRLLGLGLLAAGGIVLGRLSRGRLRWVGALAGMLVLGAWAGGGSWDRLQLTHGGHVYFQPHQVFPDSHLDFFHEDTLGGITTVVSRPVKTAMGEVGQNHTLLSNGKFQANDTGEQGAQTGFALAPALYASRRERALVIGLGSGHSAGIIQRLGFSHLDIAEISPGIVEAARLHFGHINDNVLDQPNTKLFLEDGRNHLMLHRNVYDLVTMEVSSVWFAGSTSLYSREFYKIVKMRLAPGGVFQQWIQMHHIGLHELGSVLATLRSEFPEVSFWFIGGQGVLVASERPQVIPLGNVAHVLAANPWNSKDVEGEMARLLACRVLAPREMDRLLGRVSFPLNTDANRFLEYATPRYYLDKSDRRLVNLTYLLRFTDRVLPDIQPELPEGLRHRAQEALRGAKN